MSSDTLHYYSARVLLETGTVPLASVNTCVGIKIASHLEGDMIIGFNSQKKYFSRLLKDGQLTHAYLFAGPEAIGKKVFALEIARENDQHLHDTTVITPDAERALGTISIDQVRALNSFCATTPAFGRYKFVIIDDAHRLTDESANALLKSIEEPYPSLVWILITHQPDALPATIRSRCQEIRFLPQGDAAVSALPTLKKLSPKDSHMILALAQGRVGWAIAALAGDDLSAMRQAITQWEKLPTLSILDRLAYVRALAQGETMSQVVSWWLAWARTQLPQQSVVAHKLLALMPVLQQSQFNHRLALENFLLAL
ncbi:MAG: AAA family ATPase [Patescibacteria group bacterium]